MEEVKAEIELVPCPCITFRTREQAEMGRESLQRTVENILLADRRVELRRPPDASREADHVAYWRGTDIPVQRWPEPSECLEGFYIFDPMRHSMAAEYDMPIGQVTKVYKSVMAKVPTAVPQSYYTRPKVT